MKRLYFISIMLVLSFGLFAQSNNKLYNKTLSNNPTASDYTYYVFPVGGGADKLAWPIDTAIFKVNLNKNQPCDVQWYVGLDTLKTTSNPDSINMDIKMQYSTFDVTYTTLKTIAWDGDASGDYAAVVCDSSYIYTPPLSNAHAVSMTKPEFSRIAQLTITPTSGAGLGHYRDGVKIRYIAIKVFLR